MRERVYKLALVLTVVFIIDAILMIWALIAGGYAGLGYFKVSLIPLFLPATLLSLILTGIYVHGFRRRSWTARTRERVFFWVFGVAVAVKVVPQIFWGG